MSDQSPRTSDAVEAFVVSLRQRSVPINTIKSYAHDLRLFVQVVPADLPAVTAETLQAFLASFSHLSAATRRRRYCTLRAFYHWLIRHGVVETNPMERLDSIEQGQRERTVMLTAAPESIRLLRRHLKQSHITSGSVFRGDPRYGGSPLPLEYSVVHYAWQKYCKAAQVQARFTNSATAALASSCKRGFRSPQYASSWGIVIFKARCSTQKLIKPPSKRICEPINDAKEGRGNDGKGAERIIVADQ